MMAFLVIRAHGGSPRAVRHHAAGIPAFQVSVVGDTDVEVDNAQPRFLGPHGARQKQRGDRAHGTHECTTKTEMVGGCRK